MKLPLFKFAYNLGMAGLLRKTKPNGVTVLCLHRISPDTDFFFQPMHPGRFESLVKYCVKHYEIVSFADINKKTSKPKLILSFDDGYYDFMQYALPILKKYDLPSNHNLVNSCLNEGKVIWTQQVNDICNFLRRNRIYDDEKISFIGKSFEASKRSWSNYYLSFFHELLKLDSKERDIIIESLLSKYNIVSSHRMMSWEDAKECMKHGVEIGSHTYNHNALSTLDLHVDFEIEVDNSINEFEKNLNTKIKILSLPNGQYNEKTLDHCNRLDLEYILLVQDKINPQNKLHTDHNLVNRIYLVDESTEEMILRTELLHAKIRNII